MEYLLIILAIEIIFCGIEYIYAKAVFVNPTFFAFIVVTASTLVGTIGNSYWNVKISPLTILVIFNGFLAALFANIVAKKTTKKYKYNLLGQLGEIKIAHNRINVVLCIVVICTMLYCFDILRAGAAMGRSGWSAIYAVKRNNSGTNILIRQGVKIVMAAMFIHTFIFANNVMVLGKRGFKHYKHLIPAFCAVVCCIFTSVRTEIFRVITALTVSFCILIFEKHGWKTTGLRMFIKKILPYIAIGLFLLVSVRFIVKGTENATSNTYGSFMYIAYYIGTPIIVLGSKLDEGIGHFRGSVFGEITFNRFYDFLRRLGLFREMTLQEGSRNVWIDQANKITANVDTLFGPPTIDFGIIGMSMYIFILFYVLNKYFYKYIYKTQSSCKRNTKVIAYSFFAAISSMAYYTNYLNQYLTVYFVLTYILIKMIERYYGLSSSVFK